MPRNKAARNCKIKPWLSAKPDSSEGRFIQIGNSLLLSKSFQDLSPGAQMLYLCMALESGGGISFTFPRKSAIKYGISETSFRRYILELEEKSFLKVSSNANLRKPNDYTFSLLWKDRLP